MAILDLNIDTIRDQFPILKQKIGRYPLVYLDNAATTQKPQCVLDAISAYYTTMNSNVHRATYELAARTEQKIEQVRAQIAGFLHAESPEEIIFTAGTTGAINLLAASYGGEYIGPDDEVLVSAMEHHSNFLPWQQLCRWRGAQFKVIPITTEGEINMEAFARLLTPKTKLVAISLLSNVLGTVNSLKKIIQQAHHHNAAVVVDAAQAVARISVDVQALDCDFLAFSGHKMYGPTGIGVLYSKKALLEKMRPYERGGGMVRDVAIDQITYEAPPLLFEAGTPNLAGIVGLGQAITFLDQLGMQNVHLHEEQLTKYAEKALPSVPGLEIVGLPEKRLGIISFTIEHKHPLDVGVQLDSQGCALRTGKHCAAPLLHSLGLDGTIRVSFGVYNTRYEIDHLITLLQKVAYL